MSTKKQAATAYHQLGQVLRDLEIDLRWGLEDSPRIPREWHQIAQERIQPARQKISLRVDADVVRFFRAMGEGHLARMNAVLRAFMLSRLAGVVQGEMSYDITPEAREQHKRLDLMERFKAAKERGEA
jgi:hypothetical protein